MDPHVELRDIAEIEGRLCGPAPDLRDRIIRDIGSFTIALLSVTQREGQDFLQLAGTGTLVAFAHSRYILTVAHVWHERLKAADRIGITLKEGVEHRYLIPPSAILPFSLDKPEQWNEWGPDLALLLVPPELADEIGAVGRGVFYNLSREHRAGFEGWCIETRLLMGTPESLGTFTDAHAALQITGMFSSVDNGPYSRIPTSGPIYDAYDYLDLDMDVTRLGTPQNFGGVSGGGLWRVFVYRDRATGQIAWAKDLEGVAFHQSALTQGHRALRCHGPQSIGMAIRLLI